MEDLEARLLICAIDKRVADLEAALAKHREVLHQLMALPAMSKGLAKALVKARIVMCINWTLLAGLAVCSLVWWYTIKVAAYGVCVLLVREYGLG